MSTSFQQLVKRLTADRKRFGLMLGLLAIAGVMWAKLMFTGGEPSSASASGGNPAQASQTSKEGAKGEAQTRPVVYIELSDASRRNLFSLKADGFARITPQVSQTPQNSVPEPSEEQKRTQASVPLKALKLRSTLMSASPQAFINDRLYAVGSQPAPGFVITRITQHSVFLKHEQFQAEFELKMYRD